MRVLTAIDVKEKFHDGREFRGCAARQTRIVVQRTIFRQSKLFHSLLFLQGSRENVRIYFAVPLQVSMGWLCQGAIVDEKGPRVQTDQPRRAQSFFYFCMWDLKIWIVGFAQARPKFSVALLLGWLSIINFVSFCELLNYKIRRM